MTNIIAQPHIKKIYGPWKNKKGRCYVNLIWSDGRKEVKSLPRLLMASHLGRYLTGKECVDHIDNNPSNNNIDNLQVLSWKQNTLKSRSR